MSEQSLLLDTMLKRRPTADEARLLGHGATLPALVAVAGALRDQGHGALITYSRKVFIPLTKLCRDVCHYCTFAQPPRRDTPAYLPLEDVLRIAREGARQGCKEALFTLGDKPERRYQAARSALQAMGHASTIDYLIAAARAVLEQTGLLPHVNPGVLNRDEMAALRNVSVSQGMMLESLSPRLAEPGGPHHGSPDKHPAARLETLRLAGELRIPFTTGLLVGIGETRDERLDALLAIRDLHERYGHVQEVILQNFRAKPGTRMANATEPPLSELVWTIAMARIVLGPSMHLQAPPNLSPDGLEALVAAGLDDWGGVSPVTIDHVNPEAPWPEIERLRTRTAAAGKTLAERLAIYPEYAQQDWIGAAVRTPMLRLMDAQGLAREDAWASGISTTIPRLPATSPRADGTLARLLDRAAAGDDLSEADIAGLFAVRGDAYHAVVQAADTLREATVGDTVTYAVNRNINYTNVCSYRCRFCAFSKGKLSENLRGKPYVLDLDEIARRVAEAWARGATEVCLQGGIHPGFTGQTYLDICATVKSAAPGMHVHAFSPLEVHSGAASLGLPVPAFLERLAKAGLGSLPGTAAEILDDEVRAVLCPDKINTAEWLAVIEAAHRVGLRTTATIMYGHIDRPIHWARHLRHIRALQQRTGGFTEFVPLPFVALEAPLFLQGQARPGPTFREAVLMHAVARLALHPVIANIQTSWVKMGRAGAAVCLNSGANDLGGTLMNESITRAAGAQHGEEMPPAAMETLIRDLGRTPRQRRTDYSDAPRAQHAASFTAQPLAPLVLTSAKAFEW
jgi:FO synthase